MSQTQSETRRPLELVKALGETPIFEPGAHVRICMRCPVGHYHVPTYVRGKHARVEFIVEPPGVNNEEEGFGRNAGMKRHYYRVSIPLLEVWPDYNGIPSDRLHIEIFETWLEGT